MMHIKFAKRIWPQTKQKSTVAAYEIQKKKWLQKSGDIAHMRRLLLPEIN